MNTLREALQDYLAIRRSLGFKLHNAGVGLQEFVSFLEQQRASHITTRLALKWAQQPRLVKPIAWAQRLSYVRGFARYRSATDPSPTFALAAMRMDVFARQSWPNRPSRHT